MSRDEFKMIVAALKSNYINFTITNQMQFDLWFENLQDLKYEVVEKAVKKIILECEFPPTIATIRKQCLGVTGIEQKDGSQVLGVLNEAINTFGFYQTDKALTFIKLQDESLYEITKRIGFHNLCKANPEFYQDRILRIYNQVSKKDYDRKLLPNQFERDIRAIQSNALITAEGEY